MSWIRGCPESVGALNLGLDQLSYYPADIALQCAVGLRWGPLGGRDFIGRLVRYSW